jgi:hypothetical protein
MRFFPKGLNPFKIQTRFKVDLFQKFIIQNLERFGVGPKRLAFQVWRIQLQFELICNHAKFGEFWAKGRPGFCIFQFEAFELIWKSL